MSNRARAFCLVVLAAVPVALTPLTSPAATLRVDVGGGGDYTTIQPALTAASDGDTVLIAPGTYTGEENRALVFGNNKNLVVESESGFPTVTIDCQGLDRAFYIYQTHQDTTSAIRGLIIENGYTDNYNGGAVSVGYTDVANGGAGCRIRNCVFQGNSATYRAGALMVDFASAYVYACLFCDMSGDDFTLCSNSPALPAGNVYSRLMGFAGQGCGTCDSAIREATWGSIKALYRK